MSDTYTKLFRSITASTIVSEPLATRWLWVTMLSQADSQGCVWGSVPGIARLANITLQECEEALACLYAPDPYSRTKEHGGRRIEEIDGGWRLLNHAKYDAIRNEAERTEYKREWDRKNRPSGQARASQSDSSPTQSDTVRQNTTKPDSPTPPTPALSKAEKQKQEHVQPSAARSRFDDFWLAYPNKKGKQEAEKTWRKRRLDHLCDDLIAHVQLMQLADDGWQRGYVPMGSTYLNQARWEDEPKPAPSARAGPASAESKTLTGMKAIQGMKSGLVQERDYRRVDGAHVLELGSDACRRHGANHSGDVD